MIDTNSTLNGIAAGAQGASTVNPKGDMDRESFMKLLVAQLQNQDPLDPMDAREMVTQLSELTSVEKLQSIDQSMVELRAETAGLASTAVNGLVGRSVTARANGLTLQGTGAADGQFQLLGHASNMRVSVRDAAGEVVQSIDLGEGFPGGQGFSWDGTTLDGGRAAAGQYYFDVSATNEVGTPVATSNEVTGVATEISYESGSPVLVVGNARVALGDVVSIGL